jgi:hypothetical protein
MNQQLFAEQRRVYDAAFELAVSPWPYLTPDVWTPHITMCMGLTSEQLGPAMSVILPELPLAGYLDTGPRGRHYR